MDRQPPLRIRAGTDHTEVSPRASPDQAKLLRISPANFLLDTPAGRLSAAAFRHGRPSIATIKTLRRDREEFFLTRFGIVAAISKRGHPVTLAVGRLAALEGLCI
jgi:hypothetical protein